MGALLFALAAPVGAAPLRAAHPSFSLSLEGQFAQPDAVKSRGFGLGLQAAWKLTDQLSITGGAAGLISRAGQMSTLSFGLLALLDSTPVAPFLEIAIVQLGPESTTGYGLATRTGGGADWRITPGLALGFAVRTLTPMDPGAASRSLGTEIALRVVLTPALLR